MIIADNSFLQLNYHQCIAFIKSVEDLLKDKGFFMLLNLVLPDSEI